MSHGEDAPGGGKTAWAGYLLAAACLVWVFHDIRWGEMWTHVSRMNWWLLIPSVSADIGSYVMQGVRWSLLLKPLGRLSSLKATQAVYAGLFVNEVLPMRVGEVLRGYLASRWIPLHAAQVLSSMLVERFLDGIWMVLAVAAVIWTVPLPEYLVQAEELLAIVMVAAAILLVYLVTRTKRGWLGHVACALREIGGARSIYGAAAFSALLLVLQAVSFWLVMLAYHIDLPLWHGAVVYLIVHLGTLVPGAPSNVGTYQFFTVVGLSLFGVEKTMATGFSVVVFLILTVPLWAIGLAAFGRAGLSLKTARAELRSLKGLWQRG